MQAPAFPRRNWMLALAGLGLMLSLALEYVHYRAYVLPSGSSFCALGEHLDCTSVALSRYGVLLGIPLPLFGAVGFMAIALAAWQGSRWLLLLTGLAAAASGYLLAVSAFVLGAFCLLCEGVHALSFALLLLAWRARRAELVSYRAREVSFIVLGPPLGLLLALGLFLPAYWGAFSWKGEVPFAHGKTPEGYPWIGASEPELTLEEFIDYSCPHCRAASARSLMSLGRHSEKLRLVRRHFPRTPCLPRSESRCLATRIALCADEQDRFWQADRWLFEHALAGEAPELSAASRELGLELGRLEACVESGASFERAHAEWRKAKKLRLPGTPYYAAGNQILPHARAFELIDAL